MSIEALQTALQGLRITQKQLDIASRNIANVQTPGYTRKNVPLQTVVVGTNSFSVLAGNLQRTVDTALQKDVWRQTGDAERLTTLSSYMDRIIQVYGQPDSEDSIAAGLSNLKDTFTKLSATPNSTVLQQEAVTRASTFAKDVNQLGNLIQSQRNQAQSDIISSVSTINEQLSKIATLNKQISAQVAVGQSAPDLEDQRDEAVRLVSEQMNISTFSRPDGVLVVQTREGRFLADTTAAELSYGTSPPTAPGQPAVPPPQLGATSAYTPGTPPLAVPALWIGYGANATDITQTAPSGNLGALVELRDSVLPTAQAQLDEMAYGVVKQFNAAGLRLFTDAANTNPAGAAPNLSDPTVPPPAGHLGLAQQLKVNAAIDPLVGGDPSIIQKGTEVSAGPPPVPLTNPGDPTVLNKVLSLSFGTALAFGTTGLGANGQIATGLPGNTTILDFTQQIIAKQSNDKALVDQRQSFEVSFRDSLVQRSQNQSSVNLDQETASIITVQKSYAASAQVISAVNRMLDDLLAAVRA